jgi:RNA polymerase sigma-70 factor (ECF subfamily)
MFETSWRRYGVRSESWVGEMDREAVSPVVSAKSDADLVALARSGDESAWIAIVEQHWHRVWSLSRLIVRDQHGAEEVVQETFRAARERLGAYRGGVTLCGWIQTLCRQRALDELRRRGRQSRETPAGADRPVVERALGALEAEEREALLLTEAGYALEDLAAALGVPGTTVRSRVARARACLVEQLEAGDAV